MQLAKTILCLALICSLPVLAGCGKTKTGDGKTKTKTGEGDGHPTKGPNGGMIVEVGKDHKYHAEIQYDRKKGTVTVHILDETGKKEKAIKAKEVTISFTHDDEQEKKTLAAKPKEGQTDEMSSRFEIVDKHIVHELVDHGDANSKLLFTVDGKTRSGKFQLKKEEK